MKESAFWIVSALALSACNRGPQVNLKNATGQQVAEAVSKSAVGSGQYMIQPGEWVTRTSIVERSYPGMSAEFQQQMQRAMAAQQPNEVKRCVTPDEARKPNEDFFAGQDSSCRFAHFTMGKGRIDVQMVCQQQLGTQTSNISGTYSPTSYSMEVSTLISGGERSGAMTKMHVEARRIGGCPAAGS
jgi:hypothetical protein